MDQMITGRYVLTGDDYVEICVAATRYTWRRSGIMKLGRVLFYVLMALVVFAWLANRGAGVFDVASLMRDLPIALVLIGSVVYLAYPRNVINRLWFLRHFRTLPESLWSIEWGFDHEILWARNALAEGTYRWELFPTVVEAPRCFLFYQGRQNVLWLPSHAFSSPGMLRMLRELARNRAENYVVLGECQFPAKPEPVGLDDFS